MSETRALGEWVAATGLGDLPEDVVHDTKRLILDQLGCQVGCARLPWSRAVLGAIRGLSGSGPATVVVFGDRLPADDSNATQAAQLSIRFATAVAARHGPAVLADLGPGQFNDPEVLDLARRVDVYREVMLRTPTRRDRTSRMRHASTTRLVLESDRSSCRRPVGSPAMPMTDADRARHRSSTALADRRLPQRRHPGRRHRRWPAGIGQASPDRTSNSQPGLTIAMTIARAGLISRATAWPRATSGAPPRVSPVNSGRHHQLRRLWSTVKLVTRFLARGPVHQAHDSASNRDPFHGERLGRRAHGPPTCTGFDRISPHPDRVCASTAGAIYGLVVWAVGRRRRQQRHSSRSPS